MVLPIRGCDVVRSDNRGSEVGPGEGAGTDRCGLGGDCTKSTV